MGDALEKLHDESIADYARDILQSEARALNEVSGVIGETLEKAVELVLKHCPPGRLIVSGMGKAGYVAMKLSATLSSIGYPSFFLHPADAIHGDLGRCTKDDLVLILSNSGETPELLRLLPLLKGIGATIVSITGSGHSTLATHSDLAVVTGKIQEAGPLGLAPTTSTTVMMAIGDALAMSLIKKRGFSREEFALYHPGGDLGRALLTVSQIMRQGEYNCVVHSSLLTREVLHKITITKGKPGAVSIVDDNGLLVGCFTDGDLRRHLEIGVAFLEKPIAEIMSRTPKTLRPEKLAQESRRMMQEFKIDQVLVVDEQNRPVGLVDIQDLLSHGIK